MQTLILGTKAAREPLEDFVQKLGDGEIEIVDAEGNVRAHLIPTQSDEETTRHQKMAEEFSKLFLLDIEKLKQRAGHHEKGITTVELLQNLNSLPCPE